MPETLLQMDEDWTAYLKSTRLGIFQAHADAVKAAQRAVKAKKTGRG